MKPLNAGEVPPVAVTVNVRRPAAAPAVIVIVIGRLVAVPPLPIVAVTPVPLNATAVAPVSFVPVMVADTVVPCVPDAGLIAVIAGQGVLMWRVMLPVMVLKLRTRI